MSEEASQVEQYLKTTSRLRRRATQIFLIAVIICAAVVLPPFVNISRYQREITALMTRSLGRPVRLSSVNLRLLPRPGFVLNNLSVAEAQEFGVEPILSAESVVASIRLSALLTGKVEVDRINLDNASLNLVQSSPGRWNVEPFMMGGLVQGMNQTAPTAAQPVFRRQPAAFPYLEAHNSRVNIKHGLEKLPYSLTNTQLSFWQESPGVWRLRLRGQPSRTDMEISAGDTGDLRLEGTLQTLPGRGLYQMPLKIQAAWREAQLGQLSRLLLGSDQGWRGDLTADLNIQGTADSAQTEARLRATSVRREEFVPASPMDFDVHCGLLYQHTQRAIRNLACNTGIGGGKLAVKADLPGNSGQPEATLMVDGLPLQAGLDMLRTVRNGFAPNLSADGKVSGELHLNPQQPAPAKPARPSARNAAPATPTQSAFQGELTITDGALRGGPLSRPISLPRMVLTAAELPASTPGNSPKAALITRFPLPLSAPAGNKTETAPASSPGSLNSVHGLELNIRLQLTSNGYEVAMNGSAAPERVREVVYALGVKRTPALDSISGGQADLDGVAGGPWIAPAGSPGGIASQGANSTVDQKTTTQGMAASVSKPVSVKTPARATQASMPIPGSSDEITGSVRLHHTSWSAPYLAHGVEFSEAVINFARNTTSANGNFTYGALSGTAALTQISCTAAGCSPQIEIHLGDADAATIEGALLG
ncbi:MAG TPA: AsmA family protein, partial [Acidobacteriaceae bacterium]